MEKIVGEEEKMEVRNKRRWRRERRRDDGGEEQEEVKEGDEKVGKKAKLSQQNINGKVEQTMGEY